MTPEEIVDFAEGLARVAASGGGAKALAAHLAEVTGLGVVVEDAERRHLATAGDTRSPLAGSLPIFAGATALGSLSLYSGIAAREDFERVVPLARLAASTIAVELAREHDGGRGRRRTFWERLLAHTYHDPVAARDDAVARGITLAQQYAVIVLEPEVSDEAHAPAELADLRTIAAEVFRGTDADVGLLDRGAMLVVLAPAQREVDAENARTAAMLFPKVAAKRKPSMRITGGVGMVAPLLGVSRSFESAQAALTITRRLYGVGRVGVHDDLGAYPLLLAGADVSALRAFATGVLAPLRAYDDKHQTELEKTLRLYFDLGENVKTAAGELNVHRHTVFYRLRQIAEISGRSLESAHDQLTLRLAMAIDALHTD